MAAASQNNLSLVVNQQDVNGVNILNRTIGAIAYPGTVGQYTDGLLTGTGAVAFTLPTTNVYQLMFLNTHATAVITVNWTPANATGSIIAKDVGPGGVLVFWEPTQSVSGCITAITGTSNTANATFSMFLGG
jgi:hypothetical protein